MIDWNILLQQHPDIAKWALILFLISEGLGMLPTTITNASSVSQLLFNGAKALLKSSGIIK